MTTRNRFVAVAKLRIPIAVASVVFSLAFIAASAGAATISLNYRSTDTQNGSPGDYLLNSTDVAGVVAADNWNDQQHSNLGAPVTTLDLTDSNGAGTTADLTVASSTGSAGPGQGVSGASSNNKSVLLSPKAIGTNQPIPNAAPFTMTLSGAEIPYATYDVIVYLNDQRSNSENTSVEATLGGTTYYLQTPDNDESFFDTFGFVPSTDTVDAGDFNNTVANYVRFDGVSGANFSIDFAATQGNTTFDSSRLGIGGVQITEASPVVPEPNTFALGVLALLGLALPLRRRRNR